MNKLADNLRYHINTRKSGLYGLAGEIGQPPGKIESWINGITEPGMDELLRLAKALNTSTDRLLKADAVTGEIRTDIKLLVLDVDATLTDGGMYITESLDEMKKFHSRDGMALNKLAKAGIEVAFLSSGTNMGILKRRAEMLSVKYVYGGRKPPKLEVLTKWLEELSIGWHEVAYIGDDVNDAEVMEKVALSACPADAGYKIKQTTDVILNHIGGRACVREFVERFLLDIS